MGKTCSLALLALKWVEGKGRFSLLALLRVSLLITSGGT